MAQAQKMAKTSERTAKLSESQRALKAKFNVKFGHAYDTQGYDGHPTRAGISQQVLSLLFRPINTQSKRPESNGKDDLEN